MKNKIIEDIKKQIEQMEALSFEDKVEVLNEVREALHLQSPFCDQPVDYVKWVKGDDVYSNDYNPNHVAPPEMKLLGKSIDEDGFTMPIVSAPNEDRYEIVDGFHRSELGKKKQSIVSKTKGYLPVTQIRQTNEGRTERQVSTIRHNRARGSHDVDQMVNIVSDMVDAGMSDSWIASKLGMSPDELLRLKQISGLASMFVNGEFGKSWEVSQQ